MAGNVYSVCDPDQYRKAGPTDLVELLPPPGGNPLYLQKWLVETLVFAIVHHEFVHLSGPTGSAKSSLLEALYTVPENFRGVCDGLGCASRPLKLFPIEMATFEAPGELYQRRALKDCTTYDEPSRLVAALAAAARSAGSAYPLIWLREIGRVHSSSVQGGLLNLMTRAEIVLPDGTHFPGQGIAWVADSNYQAEQSATHTLVTLDDALKRRFTINLTLDYLTAEQEVQVLEHIFNGNGGAPVPAELIVKVVQLGNVVRRHRSEGNLQTLTPPTIYGYMAFLRTARALPHLSLQQVALATLLGNAGSEDRKHVAGVFNEVFGLQTEEEEDPTMVGNLF